MDNKKILIVDDEAAFCEIVKENLELRGNFKVSIATNGRDGLALAKKIKPDLILLDIRMPMMDGFKVLEKLKQNMDTIEIPVVMLSALDDDASKLKSSQLYNDLYLTKPVKLAELQTKIEEVLSRRGKQP